MPGSGAPRWPDPVRAAAFPAAEDFGWLAAFGLLAVIAAQRRDGWLDRLDESVTHLVAGTRTEAAIRLARVISELAEPAPVGVALAVASAVAARRAGWRAACGPFLMVMPGMSARRKLSAVIARQRPPAVNWLSESEGFSLPSKHTALAALAAGTVAGGIGASRRASHAAALLAAAGVGASRVYLGVHWPTDVLAGWLFAAGWLGLCRSLWPAGRPESGSSPRRALRVGGEVRRRSPGGNRE